MKYFIWFQLICIAILLQTTADSDAPAPRRPIDSDAPAPRRPIVFSVSYQGPTVAEKGKEVILPWRISPAEAAKQVTPTWYWSDSDSNPPPSDPCTNDTFLNSTQKLTNNTRTTLLMDDDHGKATLRIDPVKCVDERNYIVCFESSMYKNGCSMKLVVGKFLPVIEQADIENQNHQNERNSESLRVQDGPAPVSEVNVILDTEAACRHLDISFDQRRVKLKDAWMTHDTVKSRRAFTSTGTLGKDGFTKGKYRWKVHVGKAESWAVGVAEESVDRTNKSNPMEMERVWTVGLSAGQYKAFVSPLTNLSPEPHPETLVVYLDIEGGQLSFYNEDNLRHIYTYMICFREKVFPFIWTMDQINWITVRPPPTAHTGDSPS